LKHIPPLGFSITEDLTGQIAASGLIVAMEETSFLYTFQVIG